MAGPDGGRAVRPRDFFRGFLPTALAPAQLGTEVRVPTLDPAGSAYVKFNRRAQDWAIVGCAAIVRDGRETVAWTGVGPTPVLADGDWRTAADGLQPTGDLSGSGEYKRHLATVVAKRALARARARA